MMTLLITVACFCLAAQAFHYVGYPLLLWGLARIRPRPARHGETLPAVSLVIAAYDEAKVIGEKLENSLALDYPALQIIVVSDGSTDATPAITAAYNGRGVVGLHQPQRRGKANAMERAAAEAAGDIVVFSDANAFYRPDAIRMLVRGFADPAVGCATGRRSVQPPVGAAGPPTSAGESLYWRYESLVKQLETRLGSTVAVAGEMLAVRRRLMPKLPDGLINDDVYIALSVLRQGSRVIYEPEAVCWEAPTSSMRDELTRRRRMTAGRYQLLVNLGWWPWHQPAALLMLLSHKILRLLLPFFMIGALLANLALEAWSGVPLLMHATLAAQLAFYALAAVGLATRRARRHWRVPAAAYYLLVGNLGSLCGFVRFVRGGQSVLWQKVPR